MDSSESQPGTNDTPTVPCNGVRHLPGVPNPGNHPLPDSAPATLKSSMREMFDFIFSIILFLLPLVPCFIFQNSPWAPVAGLFLGLLVAAIGRVTVETVYGFELYMALQWAWMVIWIFYNVVGACSLTHFAPHFTH